MIRTALRLLSLVRCANSLSLRVLTPRTKRVSSSQALAVSETPLQRDPIASPVVILHGLLGQARNFRSWATALAPSLRGPRRCVSLDLVNHGDSFSRPTMTYKEMARDVIATLDALDIEQATLLGHSMGGKVAMMAALEYGSRFERLCVFDIAPAKYSSADGSNWRGNRQLIEALAGLDLKTLADRRAADAKLAQAVLDPNIRSFALSNLVNTDGKLSWKCDIHSIISNLDVLASWDAPQGSTYNGPTLFLAGSNSRYIRSIHLPEIERVFPKFSLRTVKNAGHWIHAEAPETTVEYTREFLDMSMISQDSA